MRTVQNSHQNTWTCVVWTRVPQATIFLILGSHAIRAKKWRHMPSTRKIRRVIWALSGKRIFMNDTMFISCHDVCPPSKKNRKFNTWFYTLGDAIMFFLSMTCTSLAEFLQMHTCTHSSSWKCLVWNARALQIQAYPSHRPYGNQDEHGRYIKQASGSSKDFRNRVQVLSRDYVEGTNNSIMCFLHHAASACLLLVFSMLAVYVEICTWIIAACVTKLCMNIQVQTELVHIVHNHTIQTPANLLDGHCVKIHWCGFTWWRSCKSKYTQFQSVNVTDEYTHTFGCRFPLWIACMNVHAYSFTYAFIYLRIYVRIYIYIYIYIHMTADFLGEYHARIYIHTYTWLHTYLVNIIHTYT